MNGRVSKIVSQEEGELIRLELLLQGQPRIIKAGLQRLCSHYEVGYRLADPHEHRQLVRALLLDRLVITRRWAYKAIAHLGRREEDIQTLISRLRDETDPENQTWAMAAIIKLAEDEQVRNICARTGLEFEQPLALAARLLVHEEWLRTEDTPPVIVIGNADALTLKWAALLSGYGRAPPHLFHPKYDNRLLLGELNGHTVPEVAEYSIWAFWRCPDYSYIDLGISLSDISVQPQNVRRWINRVLAKEPVFFEKNLDFFVERRRDPAPTAREGLALGIRRLWLPGLDGRVLDWHADEQEDFIRALLLEHMAHAADKSVDYGDMVERSFRQATRGGELRQRLLAATEGLPLYASLRKIQAKEQMTDADLFQPQHLTIVEKFTMTNTNFSAGRDMTAQNMVGGNMIASANAAVQDMNSSREPDQAILTEILRLVGQSSVAPEHQEAAAKAVQEVATDGSPQAKGRLVKALQSALAGGGVALDVADKIRSLWEAISPGT
jgi:hypothetical protein